MLFLGVKNTDVRSHRPLSSDPMSNSLTSQYTPCITSPRMIQPLLYLPISVSHFKHPTLPVPLRYSQLSIPSILSHSTKISKKNTPNSGPIPKHNHAGTRLSAREAPSLLLSISRETLIHQTQYPSDHTFATSFVRIRMVW